MLRGAATTLEEIARSRGRTLGGGDRQAEPEGSGDGNFHTFNITEEFDAVGTNDLEKDRWVPLWEREVNPKKGYVWGYGKPESDEVGRLLTKVRDLEDEAVENLKIRFVSDDANYANWDEHGTYDVTEGDQEVTRRQSWLRFPERDMPMVTGYSRLIIEGKWVDKVGGEPPNIDNDATKILANVTHFKDP